MNDVKNVETVTLLESLPSLNKYIWNNNIGYYKFSDKWERTTCENIAIEFYNEARKRVEKTKEIAKYLGKFHKTDFINATQALLYKPEISITLDPNIFPLIGQRLVDGNLIPTYSSDFILVSSGWAFCESDVEKYQDDLDIFINKLFPVPNERRLMLKYCASLLHGYRTEKKFIILTDDRGGDNGKSTWVNFLCGFFGEMTYNSTRLFLNTTIQDKNGQDAILYKVHNKRLIIGSEFKAGMVLDVSLMKKLTGMDEITGRHFNSQKGFSIVSQAGIILVYNHGDAPIEDLADEAFQNRKLIFKMKSKFSKDVKEDDWVNFTFRAKRVLYKRFYSAFLHLLRQQNTDWDDKNETLGYEMTDDHLMIEDFLYESIAPGNGFIRLPELFKKFSGKKMKQREFIAIAKQLLVARGGKFDEVYNWYIKGRRTQTRKVVHGFINI